MLALVLALVTAAYPFASREASPTPALIAELAASLSDGDTNGVLSHFDPAMPDYRRFAGYIAVLASEQVGCSIRIVKEEVSGSARRVELDWYLELPEERRRGTIHITIAPAGKGAKITALDPVAFFAPKA